ncbi:MAG TPA: hypothetical protein VLN57_09830 [Xanthobacteraceae bacterium]|jgi:hypothetical protein|nr:hypothetical protein [Xanthobacteraceae bacterium]
MGTFKTGTPAACGIAAAMLVVLAVLGPATAEVRIKSSPGGQIGEFLDLFEEVRATGERVVIDGPCLSACTLVLGVVPRSRICVTSRAVLGFHAAWVPAERGHVVPQPEATRLMMDLYPAEVRGWILRRGGLNSHLILLRGHELTAIYPHCT